MSPAGTGRAAAEPPRQGPGARSGDGAQRSLHRGAHLRGAEQRDDVHLLHQAPRAHHQVEAVDDDLLSDPQLQVLCVGVVRGVGGGG